MKNIDAWEPTKFIKKNDRYLPNAKNVFPGSLITIDILSKVYYDIIKSHVKGKLLDLGCGNVPLYEMYKDYIDDNTCVDWENSLHNNIHLDFEMDLNSKLNLDNMAYDTILLTDVIEHVLNVEILFSEISRILKPGGMLIIGVPFMYWLHEEPHDYQRLTSYKLQILCKRNKLNVVSLTPYGGPVEILCDITSKCLANWPFLVKSFNQIATLMLRLKIIKNFSQRNAEKFPLGYCLVAEKSTM